MKGSTSVGNTLRQQKRHNPMTQDIYDLRD